MRVKYYSTIFFSVMRKMRNYFFKVTLFLAPFLAFGLPSLVASPGTVVVVGCLRQCQGEEKRGGATWSSPPAALRWNLAAVTLAGRREKGRGKGEKRGGGKEEGDDGREEKEEGRGRREREGG
uniref:Uncharacterized protein n=1 Tax=Solanum lycopersicum TaxID=4081 RepID=A0A3Q7HQ26_SOLLC